MGSSLPIGTFATRLSAQPLRHVLRTSVYGQPVEKVVVGPVSSPEPHPNTWTSTPKHCNGRVFESLKDARNGPRGVFQQAGRKAEVQRIGTLGSRVNKGSRSPASCAPTAPALSRI